MKNILLYIIVFICFCEGISREKRKIVFRKNSKMFLRLNGIQPFIKWNTIFRQGFGFRGNWDLPDTKEKYFSLFESVQKRDVHNDIDELAKNPKTTDLICVIKYFMEMITNVKEENCTDGLFCNLSRIVQEHDGIETIFFRTIFNKFSTMETYCPGFDLVPVESPDLVFNQMDLDNIPLM